MPRRVERDGDVAERQPLAIGDRLGRSGEAFAIARRHDRQRFPGRQHAAVAGAGMVGMAVGDECALHRPGRVDVEVAGRAPETGRRGGEQLFRAHGGQDRRSGPSRQPSPAESCQETRRPFGHTSTPRPTKISTMPASLSAPKVSPRISAEDSVPETGTSSEKGAATAAG